MKYREFVIKSDVNQKEYVDFRIRVQEMKPAPWAEINDLPDELFYDVLVRGACDAGWIEDVIEENEYGEETTFSWKDDGGKYLDGLPPISKEFIGWGSKVLQRWLDIKTIDPN